MGIIMNDVAAVILAGGKSSRMGRDKALLPYQGARLIDRMIRVVEEIGCSTVVVSGFVDGYHCINDINKNCGPMGGIHAVLQAAIKENMPRAWLFVPVDMPAITPGLLARLSSSACAGDYDAACFENNPLPLFIKLNNHVINCLNNMELKFLSGQKIAVKDFLGNMKICRHTVSAEERPFLVNTNTPEEWHEVMKGMAS